MFSLYYDHTPTHSSVCTSLYLSVFCIYETLACCMSLLTRARLRRGTGRHSSSHTEIRVLILLLRETEHPWWIDLVAHHRHRWRLGVGRHAHPHTDALTSTTKVCVSVSMLTICPTPQFTYTPERSNTQGMDHVLWAFSSFPQTLTAS